MFEVEIGGKNYTFDINREIAVRFSLDNVMLDLLTEQELQNKTEAQVQELLQSKIKEMKGTERARLIEKQQIKAFYYALLKRQPEVTPEIANNLYNQVFEEYGADGLGEINKAVEELNQNFIRKANENKKKIQIRKF